MIKSILYRGGWVKSQNAAGAACSNLSPGERNPPSNASDGSGTILAAPSARGRCEVAEKKR